MDVTDEMRRQMNGFGAPNMTQHLGRFPFSAVPPPAINNPTGTAPPWMNLRFTTGQGLGNPLPTPESSAATSAGGTIGKILGSTPFGLPAALAGSAIGGISNIITNSQRLSAAKAMREQDFEAARSLGLAHPSQIPSSGFQTIRNGPHSVSNIRSVGPSQYM